MAMRRIIAALPQVSSDRQPCEFPLHENANAQGPRNELSASHHITSISGRDCSGDLVLRAYLIRLMSVSSASAQKSLQKKRSPLPFQAEVSASARPHAAQVRLCISLSAILTKAQTVDPRKQSRKLAELNCSRKS